MINIADISIFYMMFYLLLLVTCLIHSNTSSCSNVLDYLNKDDDISNFIPEYELLELFEEFEAESRSQNILNNVTTYSGISPIIFTAAAIIGVPLVLTSLAPPTLPMFPPQGAIQPGSVTEGGGVLPTSAILRFFSPLEEGPIPERPVEEGPIQVGRPLVIQSLITITINSLLMSI